MPIHNIKQRRSFFTSRTTRERYAISFSRCSSSSCPAQAGKGDHRSSRSERRMVEGASDSSTSLSSQDNPSWLAPPPPCSPTLAWSPSPAIAGADARVLVLAMRLSHPRFAARFRKARPIAPIKRREAERRKARTYLPCPAGPGARHTNECCHPSALRARSPFGAPPRYSPRRTHPDIGSALSPALPETRLCGALPRSTCLSPPRSAETGRSAGRAVTRGRPGTVCETARGNRTCSTF